MQQARGIFRIIRTGNLLLIFLTQLLAFGAFTGFNAEGSTLLSFLGVSIATICAAAAGYIVNDMEDVGTDLVNKPQRVVVNTILPSHVVMYLYIGFNLVALVSASLVNREVTLAVALCILLLWFYAVHFKRTWLTGNILVAGMSAFVLLIYPLCHVVPENELYRRYALFAFALSLIREIVKDAEDIPGDRYAAFRTLPVRSGLAYTKRILIWLCGISILLIIMHLTENNYSEKFHEPWLYTLYLVHMILGVILPLFALAFLIYRATTVKEFTRMSMYCKLIMFVGLISMLYFKM